MGGGEGCVADGKKRKELGGESIATHRDLWLTSIVTGWASRFSVGVILRTMERTVLG